MIRVVGVIWVNKVIRLVRVNRVIRVTRFVMDIMVDRVLELRGFTSLTLRVTKVLRGFT